MTFNSGVAVGAVAHGPLPESVGFGVGAEGGRPRRPCRRRSGTSVDQFGRQAGAVRFGQASHFGWFGPASRRDDPSQLHARVPTEFRRYIAY